MGTVLRFATGPEEKGLGRLEGRCSLEKLACSALALTLRSVRTRAYCGGRGSPLDLRPAFRTTLLSYLWLALRRWLELRHRHPALRGGVSATRRRAAAQYEVAAPQIAALFRR
jgi:hypothetical protein